MVTTLVLTATLAPLGWLIQKYWIHETTKSVSQNHINGRNIACIMEVANIDFVGQSAPCIKPTPTEGPKRTRLLWSTSSRLYNDDDRTTDVVGRLRHGTDCRTVSDAISRAEKWRFQPLTRGLYEGYESGPLGHPHNISGEILRVWDE